ncbi:DUF6266 family protein [Halosquirtibacter xylanolyticus]|uniref:DUF6266 family protein n=1 Tax=Halosquirtibacter xylanolyticus TaxID=3374599 RepID=UPI003749208F|nr:DUF6266 family protein [Prolixibacteraceae bacterium]
MAVLFNGILGGFKGKVGSVVGAKWKGIQTMRSLPEVVKRRHKSERCRHDRACFGKAAILMRDALKLVRVGFGVQKKQRTAYVAAMSENRKFFYWEDDQVKIDFPQIKLSRGNLPRLDHFTIHNDLEDKLVVQWDWHESFYLNKVFCDLFLFVCREDLDYTKCYKADAKASDLHFEIPITNDMKGHQLHIYGFYGINNELKTDRFSGTSYVTITL